MNSVLIAAALVVMVGAGPARAQSVTAEVDVTTGYSTERIRALASQARLFGEALQGWRFYIEGTWAEVEGPKSDAFGAAYPYEASIRPMEAYVEKMFQRGGYLAGIRAGRYRTPFGISGRSDHAYNGFLRAPLIRYDDYFALSNTFVEQGADLMVGRPSLMVEASVGVPKDPVDHRRRDGLDKVVRAQGYRGSLIVGASHLRTRPLRTLTFAKGESVFSGVDARWMRDGIQLRGEWLTGRPFNGALSRGWYIDGIVHRPAMGRLTAVVRAEALDYYAGNRSFFAKRITAGARILLTRALAGQINVLRQAGLKDTDRRAALDVALTYSVRIGASSSR